MEVQNMDNPAQQAAEVIEEAIQEEAAERVEIIEDIADAAIEHAQEETRRAEETAAVIADAAMESERGRRIDNLERDLSSCRGELSELKVSIQTLEQKMPEIIRGAIQAQEVLSQTPPEPSSLIPPNSEAVQTPTELAAEVVAAEPENLSASAEAVNPVLATPPKKKARWI